MVAVRVVDRSGWFVAVAALCALVLVRPQASDSNRALQAAVTGSGFAVAQETGSGYRVLDIDRQGGKRREFALGHTGDLRVIGTGAGISAAWREDKKLRLSRVEDGRLLGSWGTSVRVLCEGVASNDERFAVGWLEADGGYWFVHGPSAKQAVVTEVAPASVDDKFWCGIASAEQNVALLWRERDRMYLNMCTQKKCNSLAVSFVLDRRASLLGVGCVKRGCLVAWSAASVGTRISYITESGSIKWTQPLETTGLRASVIGVGSDAFAVGYATAAGPVVARFTRDGKRTQVWTGAASTSVPSVAWSKGQLLVAHDSGDGVATTAIPFAR